MRYKIVAVTDHAPDKPITYTGEFTPVDGIQPIITAIVTEFGDPGKSTNESLIEWTGGESLYWDYIDKNDTEFIFYNDDTTYYVFIDS